MVVDSILGGSWPNINFVNIFFLPMYRCVEICLDSYLIEDFAFTLTTCGDFNFDYDYNENRFIVIPVKT